MRPRLLIPALVIVAGAAGAWWWFFGGADKPVTEAEARHYLGRIVATAKARDFEALCKLHGTMGNCRHQLNQGCDERPFDQDKISCTETVPEAPPTVVSTRYLEKDGDGTPGRILSLSGTDAFGRPYQSEVLVFRENRHNFKAINAVYWANSYIIEGDIVTPGGTQK